jgi:hypothetical protein
MDALVQATLVEALEIMGERRVAIRLHPAITDMVL